MSDEATTPSSTRNPGAADAPQAYADGARPRGTGGYVLISLGGCLLCGVGMGVVWLGLYSWQVVLATTPVYILIGFVMALLLARVYDRLGVGPASFGRAIAISGAASYVAGLLWTMAFYAYRDSVAGIILSAAGGPARNFHDEWILDGGFISSFPLFGLSLIRLGLQYNTALREEREQALRAVAAARDAQLRMLAYQLNPHFLFNTLNSIRALINEDRRRARDMVTALSGYLRYALVERPLHVALLEEEVAAVRGYLTIEQVRFEERLDARMEIEPAALRCEVPAFLLNPLVENAVKHGAAGTADDPLVVRVEARLVEPDRLLLTVENTGEWKGGEKPALPAGEDVHGLPGGVGLANVRARLMALHPGDHRVGMEHGCGRVRLLVELPARYRAGAAT